MSRSIFITGTDTGVGKTTVTAAILAVMRRYGLDCVPMKPVQSGCTRKGSAMVAPDLEFCLHMAGMTAARSAKSHMCPYKFRTACSPHLASRMEGRNISIAGVRRNFRALAGRYDSVIVEGAGGVFVPLDRRNTMLDLMAALRLPTVLVARPGLGTINHTLLSLNAMRNADVPVLGVIFNQSLPGKPGRIEKDNAATIARMGKVSILGSFPYFSELSRGRLSAAAFTEWADMHLTAHRILQGVGDCGCGR